MALDILNKFTTNLKNTLVRAINLSIRSKHPRVIPLHLLMSLSEQGGSVANEILEKHHLTTDRLQQWLTQVEWQGKPRNYALPQLSPETVRVLEHAAVVAFEHQHKYIGTEHLLLSLIELPDQVLEQLYASYNVDVENVRKQTLNILKSTSRFPDLSTFFREELAEGEETKTAEETKTQPTTTPALDFFSTNLTDPSIQKKIDPVVGRSEEIDRLIHILSRRTKNNPVLLGEPGVGKTAIVEGLAKRILERTVPSVLLDKKIYRLDLGLVVAGTMYRGEFEARFKQITEELKENPHIILFIDEIHTLVGTGGAGGAAMDAANILKPGLARGEIRCIGATTLQEYQKHIESDAALERRFQPIIVEEPTMEEAIQVLEGVKPNYEAFHHVAISDKAIEAAVKFSVRYIQDKFLPDKAIDLLDEAAARFRVQRPMSDLEEAVNQLGEKLKVVQQQKLALVKDERFEEAITLKKKERDLQAQFQQVRERSRQVDVKEVGTIGAEDIATVIARITKIPLEELLASEKKRLLDLEQTLNASVIGQEEATKAVAEAIRRSRAGLSQAERPIGSFMFLGPSGVGKTELAKTLTRTVFGDVKNMVRIDMSEFSEAFTISKLIGAPAGYVGYKEGAKLTDQVRHRPYTLILFDEIEKAHRDVFNILLQILDEGQLTDATGKRVNFKNTIIVMTSNTGLRQFQEQVALGFTEGHGQKVTPQYEHVKEQVLHELQNHFRPEFLNRIDKIVVFKPLTEGAIMKIVELQMRELVKRVEEKLLHLTYSRKLVQHIARIGYTPQEGARGIRRTIQEHIENKLADMLLADAVTAGDSILATMRKGEIQLTKK